MERHRRRSLQMRSKSCCRELTPWRSLRLIYRLLWTKLPLAPETIDTPSYDRPTRIR